MKLVPFCGGTWYNEIRKACREGNVVNEPKKIRKTAIAAVVLFTCIVTSMVYLATAFIELDIFKRFVIIASLVIGIAWVSAGDDY